LITSSVKLSNAPSERLQHRRPRQEGLVARLLDSQIREGPSRRFVLIGCHEIRDLLCDKSTTEWPRSIRHSFRSSIAIVDLAA
jgi:hypothetical protein